ncbi:unnamed protein product [Oppiella nova]|uniref:Uncharacterized protein n=1 Tax=Oppiella nova TaxID=334625 RepID=A0A7R9LU80_9ACAR|nr:unnamed protein product [Oppiella nova]CAG2167004.1 unnamed protein product [Oppiella nova]
MEQATNKIAILISGIPYTASKRVISLDIRFTMWPTVVLARDAWLKVEARNLIPIRMTSMRATWYSNMNKAVLKHKAPAATHALTPNLLDYTLRLVVSGAPEQVVHIETILTPTRHKHREYPSFSNEELENFNVKYIVEAPVDADKKSIQSCDNERLKAARKRSKKLRQRLAAKAVQFEQNVGQKGSQPALSSKSIQSVNKNKISKIFKDLSTLSADTQITGHWPSNMTHSLERNLNELEKLFRGKGVTDSLYFHSLNGTQLLTKMLSRITNGTKERPTSLTDRSNAKLAAVYELVCSQHWDVSDYVLQSNLMMELLDILCHRINLLDATLISTTGPTTCDTVVGALCQLLSTIFDTLYAHYSRLVDTTDDCLAFNHLIQDVISYIVSVGMIDKLSLMMVNTRNSIRDPIDDCPEMTQCWRSIISLFSSVSKLMALKVENRFGSKYRLLLCVDYDWKTPQHRDYIPHENVSPRGHARLPLRGGVAADHTLELTLEVIRLLNYVSLLDLNFVQSILGGEGLSDVEATLLQSGQRPTVVQQLCCLPFEYFSDKRLSGVLFPTLIACCFQNTPNRTILEQEMSTLMLSTFIESTIVGLQLRAVDSHVSSGQQKPDEALAEQRLTFAKRFPKNRWNEAKDYFETQTPVAVV